MICLKHYVSLNLSQQFCSLPWFPLQWCTHDFSHVYSIAQGCAQSHRCVWQLWALLCQCLHSPISSAIVWLLYNQCDTRERRALHKNWLFTFARRLEVFSEGSFILHFLRSKCNNNKYHRKFYSYFIRHLLGKCRLKYIFCVCNTRNYLSLWLYISIHPSIHFLRYVSLLKGTHHQSSVLTFC